MSAMTAEQVQAMVTQGLTDGEIGQSFGLERRTIQSFRNKHDIPTGRPIGRNKRSEARRTRPDDAPPIKPSKPITVSEFLLNKRRAVCPICQLKAPIKEMVMDAKKKGERQQDIIEYLRECHKITVTPRDFSAHVSGRHDS